MLVRREPVVGTGLDEDRGALSHRDVFAFHLQHTGAFEDDVELVVLLRLLPVRLGRDQDLHTELETGGLVAGSPLMHEWLLNTVRMA